MTDLAVDRLRLRGPATRRLADVAARYLPTALEQVFADVEDIELERVAVRLDLDLVGKAVDRQRCRMLHAASLARASARSSARRVITETIARR